MPLLLLSSKVAATLRNLVHQEDPRKDGNAALASIKAQIETAPTVEGARYPAGTIVQHQTLVQLARWAADEGEPRRTELSLSKLLLGAQLAFAVKIKPERAPELIETLRKIQLAKEQQEYDEMMGTRGAREVPFGFRTKKERVNPWQSMPAQTEAEEWEEVRRQLGAIFNVALSVAAVVAAIWWAAGNADPIWKTLVALPISILVAVAEIALYARHWSNINKKKALKHTVRSIKS